MYLFIVHQALLILIAGILKFLTKITKLRLLGNRGFIWVDAMRKRGEMERKSGMIIR